jgi:hypothetical protein
MMDDECGAVSGMIGRGTEVVGENFLQCLLSTTNPATNHPSYAVAQFEIKWLQYLGRMHRNRFPKLHSDYKPRDRTDQGYPHKIWTEQLL